MDAPKKKIKKKKDMRGRNLLFAEGAFGMAYEACFLALLARKSVQAPVIFCRAARASIVLGPAGPVSQVRHIGRWIAHKSHHVGKWQARRETHGTASTAFATKGDWCIVREPDRAKSVRGQVPVR